MFEVEGAEKAFGVLGISIAFILQPFVAYVGPLLE